MSTTAARSCLGSHAAPKIAAVTSLVSIAVFVDLPEVSLLVGLLAYGMASDKKKLIPEWVDTIAQHKAIANWSANPVLLLLAALLAACLVGNAAHPFIAFFSAFAYVAVSQFGKRDQSKPPKDLKGDCKHGGLGARASRPWRRQTVEATASVAPNKLRRADTRDRNQSPGTSANQARVIRTGLDGEIQVLTRTCTPTKSDEAMVRRLVKMASKSILPVVPEAEIAAFPTCNLEAVGASGARPEVEMVVTVDATVLAERLKTFFMQGQSRVQKRSDTLAPELLQKTSTKVLSERLTFVRFWRSQFSGPEPMIVLLVPVEIGVFKYPIRLNFSVNTPYPSRIATLLSKENASTKELIRLVTHWARERCIANAARGHPHIYAWSLLTMYFVRHGLSSEELPNKRVGDLFKDFANFYAEWFDRRETPVQVRFSTKIVEPSAENALWGVPYIEDPFEPEKDVAACMTADGVKRIREELRRACELFARDGEAVKLAELVERWSPPPSLP